LISTLREITTKHHIWHCPRKIPMTANGTLLLVSSLTVNWQAIASNPIGADFNVAGPWEWKWKAKLRVN